MIDYNILSKIIYTISDAKLHNIHLLSELYTLNTDNIHEYFNAMYELGINVLMKQNKYCYLKEPIHLLNKKFIYKNLPKNKILIFDIINSTNQYLVKNISKLKSGDACIAEYQTHGKGKRGKKWLASFGKNICLSVYWSMHKPLINFSELSIKIGKIITKTLINFGMSKIRIKFPNDILIKDKKIAGILIETCSNKKIDIIIGIGININMNDYYSKLINIKWTDFDRCNMKIDRSLLIVKIISSLNSYLKKIQNRHRILFNKN
ncbi:MAG: biotin--[acetyl-CoA-carboxylase] ligase [Wigglesworthia glossinidia]|nr:biotin--[acetyl-CoA-carboxylase] ligase [Wigglesworthia glossinidia]